VTLSPVAVETGNGVDDEWSASKARAELVDVATGERAISAIALYVYRISISPFRLISPFVSAAAKKYEKHIEEEKLIRVPSSLDVTPYRDEKDFELFSWVVAGFAHELSHVILLSIGHRLRHDEKAVDLTAMVLGYQSFISDAEVTKTKGAVLSSLLALLLLPLGILFWAGTSKETRRLGYLTATEAKAARQYLAQIKYA
jgi:hypothetical protein